MGNKQKEINVIRGMEIAVLWELKEARNPYS